PRSSGTDHRSGGHPVPGGASCPSPCAHTPRTTRTDRCTSSRRLTALGERSAGLVGLGLGVVGDAGGEDDGLLFDGGPVVGGVVEELAELRGGAPVGGALAADGHGEVG